MKFKEQKLKGKFVVVESVLDQAVLDANMFEELTDDYLQELEVVFRARLTQDALENVYGEVVSEGVEAVLVVVDNV
ncbi:MAG: hypothetical protein D8H99_54100 [Streptococcus sp.]|nr:MAG: hypothetical protein D8H99_54100 [Streptococcus sp.]